LDGNGVYLPSPFSLAEYAFTARAKLKPGQTVFVRAGASSFGQAAIRVAASMGAIVLAGVENDQQRHIVRETTGLPDARILLSDDSNLVELIFQHTAQKGVQVIYDPFRDETEINRRLVAHGQSSISHGKRHAKLTLQ
jgi:NADPH:quinone reductase